MGLAPKSNVQHSARRRRDFGSKFMPPLVVKWIKCSVSIASARTTIDHKAYDAVISNMGFVILGDFTVDRHE